MFPLRQTGRARLYRLRTDVLPGRPRLGRADLRGLRAGEAQPQQHGRVPAPTVAPPPSRGPSPRAGSVVVPGQNDRPPDAAGRERDENDADRAGEGAEGEGRPRVAPERRGEAHPADGHARRARRRMEEEIRGDAEAPAEEEQETAREVVSEAFVAPRVHRRHGGSLVDVDHERGHSDGPYRSCGRPGRVERGGGRLGAPDPGRERSGRPAPVRFVNPLVL